MDGTKFNIPELNLLKQRYSGACSWASHVNSILTKLFERNDYHNIVEELTAILKDGKSLRVKGTFLILLSMVIVVCEMLYYLIHKRYYSTQWMNCHLLKKN